MTKLFKNILAVFSVIVSSFLLTANTFAADTDIALNRPGGSFTNLPSLTYGNIIANSIRLLLVLAAVIFFFMLVVGGIQWILAGGDKTGAENARKRITSALVGLAIVFVAWAIVSLINVLFGVDIFQLNVGNLYTAPVAVGNR